MSDRTRIENEKKNWSAEWGNAGETADKYGEGVILLLTSADKRTEGG